MVPSSWSVFGALSVEVNLKIAHRGPNVGLRPRLGEIFRIFPELERPSGGAP